MTSAEIRQSFLDFFKSKEHTIVPSSSLRPDSPNLLFTNAGMNQFVPIFLGERKADVSKWANAIPRLDTRAADTQKCIRAGGKHNDLEDVGLDTYHHTFFEMLGNWSFGDYFKQEAIDWAWELITEVWKFPKNRLYATVYCPNMNMELWENEMAYVAKIVAGGGVIRNSTDYAHEFHNSIKKGQKFIAGTIDTSLEPSDMESAQFWYKHFKNAGLDPNLHIIPGNKKDNFWMMGDTGPCGPCSELHVDLTPAGDTKGALVNKGDARCIEIWNLVFIQFNANPDGTFSPLPARHVDTGMGFERVTSIIQCTKNFTDFANAQISNYNTDIFRPIFDEIENLSGKKYTATLPKSGSTGDTEQEKIDVAFRVIADHIRTLSFAIADGILPGNNDRNYVLRRILRRAVRYGRTLGFHEPFFYKLVDILAEKMGGVFPEIRTKKQNVKDVLKQEEEAFNKTLDNGIEIFEGTIDGMKHIRAFIESIPSSLKKLEDLINFEALSFGDSPQKQKEFWRLIFSIIRVPTDFDMDLASWDDKVQGSNRRVRAFRSVVTRRHGIWNGKMMGLYLAANSWDQEHFDRNYFLNNSYKIQDGLARVIAEQQKAIPELNIVPADAAFRLYDEQGFPIDLTELMARERGLTVDVDGFNYLMEEQRNRARAAQKKTVIELSQIETKIPTHFLGFEHGHIGADVQEVASIKDKTIVVLNNSVCYAEMGGQVGDTGELTTSDKRWRILNTQKSGNTWLHFIEGTEAPAIGQHVMVHLDHARRNAIQRHHTVTHLLHWALHKVVSAEASQKGSYVGPEKLTFDFNSAPLTPQQVADIEELVNKRILENERVVWGDFSFSDIKSRPDVMQFFGDKYGDLVRVVQIGGSAGKDSHGHLRPLLDGYSMELCGGTHVRATGEIGLFKILHESAIAAGVRRIEAVAGQVAYEAVRAHEATLTALGSKLAAAPAELEKKLEALLAHQQELERQLKSYQQKNAAALADELAAKAVAKGPLRFVAALADLPAGELRGLGVQVAKKIGPGVVVIGSAAEGKASVVALCSPEAIAAGHAAGKIVGDLCGKLGGKGGGKPDFAQGGGKDAGQLGNLLKEFLAQAGQ